MTLETIIKIVTSNAKARVGFGRTEVSVSLDCRVVFCVLAFVPGPRNSGFQGFCQRLEFHVFFCTLFDIRHKHENWNLQNAKLGFCLVVQRFSVRLDGIVVCALSSGHGPRNP